MNASHTGAWFYSDETQRAHYSKRRKEIWEALHPEPSPDYSLESYDADDELEVAQLEPPQVFSHGGARPQTKGFAAATAEVTGESKAQINRNLARAEAIGDAPTRSKGTPAVFQSRVECRREHRQFFGVPRVVVSTPAKQGPSSQ